MPINNTTDAALYYDRRFGKSFSYAIPVVPGDYTLNLSFADSGYKVGQRTFNVFAEGSQILSNYDIAKDGENLVITKSFHVTVTDGTLNISFAGIVGNATLSTIEVIPSIPVPVIQWQTAASSPVVRAESLGGVIDGKLYVFGGFQNGPNNSIIALMRSDVYDPTTNTWTRIADEPEAMTHAGVVADGTTFWFIAPYVGDSPGPGSTARLEI